MTELRLATRRSTLAMAQARQVAEMLQAAHPSTTVSLVGVTTTGDADRSSPVTTLTEVGAFVRAVQQAVLNGDADMAVHSCKDLPVSGPEGLDIFFPRRAAPWDVLCGSTLDGLPEGARVGTGSPRRAEQLRQIRPDLDVAGIRGNVETRLGKVSSGEFDAIVLAEAGLTRLGLDDEIHHRFDLEQMVPAPAQGALAVESVTGSAASTMLADIDDPSVRETVEAERALLSLTGAGCRSALGALGTANGSGLLLSGFVSDEAGARRASAEGSSPVEVATRLQTELAL